MTARVSGEMGLNHGETRLAQPGAGQGAPLRRRRASAMTKRLEGKSALITGAARGIGAAFARAYAAEGATVAIGDIDMTRAEATAASIGPSAYAVPIDVTNQSSIDAAIKAVQIRAGGLDILVNNAALFDLAPFTEITRKSYDRLFSINVAGVLFTMQAASRVMIAQGRGGKIINMASQAGRRGEALVAVYCATKAAVISLTQSAGLALIRMASTSTPSRRAWWTASIGKASMRCSPNTRTVRSAKRSASSARPCRRAAWARPKISPAWRCSWPAATAITSWRRPTMSMAAIG